MRTVSLVALSITALLTLCITGWQGLLIAATAAGIGLIPVLFGSRRMNCLGIILLPLALNMSGAGWYVARFLGLL